MDEIRQQAHVTLAAVENEEVALEPTICEPPITPMLATIKPAVSVSMKKDEVLHRAFDAKLKNPDLLDQQLETMDLDKWSRFVARLDTSRNIKADVNVTAMGILAMFPVVRES